MESAIILILTVWFATFSESLSEAQAKARVDSLKNLEKEVTCRRLEHGKEMIVKSSELQLGDEVKVYAGQIIPRDGLVMEGKTFVDESMMTGEPNPVFNELDDHVMGGTKVTTENIIVEITSEAGKSYLDEMVGLIQNATRPKTQNEIALTILLAGLSIIFLMIAVIIPAISENISSLSVKIILSIFEYIVEVGVIINTEHCGFPFNVIG